MASVNGVTPDALCSHISCNVVVPLVFYRGDLTLFWRLLWKLSTKPCSHNFLAVRLAVALNANSVLPDCQQISPQLPWTSMVPENIPNRVRYFNKNVTGASFQAGTASIGLSLIWMLKLLWLPKGYFARRPRPQLSEKLLAAGWSRLWMVRAMQRTFPGRCPGACMSVS